MTERRKRGRKFEGSGARRPCPVILLPAVALVLSGCASPFRTDAEALAERVKAQQTYAASQPMPDEAEAESQSVEDMLRRGDALRSDGEYATAMWAYLQAYEVAPDNPESIARMASLHLMVEPRLAESIFRELLESHPENSAAHIGLGLTLIERQEWEAAREVLTRAVGIDPESAAAYSALGVTLDRLERPDEARDAYQRATTLNPGFYEALNNLGVSYLRTGEFDAAREVLETAAREQERDPAVFNNLGVALGRMQRYKEALKAFRRAGSEQAARNNLGYVSFLNGDYERAIEEYEKALHANGDNKLLVLRNIRAVREAEEERHASAEAPPEPR